MVCINCYFKYKKPDRVGECNEYEVCPRCGHHVGLISPPKEEEVNV
jgi:rRNA maturation endonuclease Nob1